MNQPLKQLQDCTTEQIICILYRQHEDIMLLQHTQLVDKTGSQAELTDHNMFVYIRL